MFLLLDTVLKCDIMEKYAMFQNVKHIIYSDILFLVILRLVFHKRMCLLGPFRSPVRRSGGTTLRS